MSTVELAADTDVAAAPSPDRLRACGERIEHLLGPDEPGTVLARQEAEELVRVVAELYGAALGRVLDLAHETGALDDALAGRLAADDLVGGLLLVHGLHPHGVREGAEDVLPGVGAAPDTRGVGTVKENGVPTRDAEPAGDDTIMWEPIHGLAEISSDVVRGVQVAGVGVLVCRLGSRCYAFRDECPSCGAGLTGAAVERRLGADAGAGVLTCPACRGHFDVARAGRSLDGEGVHLAPLPLLEHDGVIRIAVPDEAPA